MKKKLFFVILPDYMPHYCLTLTNALLFILDNAPVSKALLVITGATSTLNVLFPLLNIQAFNNSGILNYIENSKV